jgi:hypothetical protein
MSQSAAAPTPPVNRRWPSGEDATEYASSEVSKIRFSCPVAASQSFASGPSANMNRPSGERATDLTLPAALRIVRSNAPVSVKLLMNSGRSINPECLIPSGKEEPRWDHPIDPPHHLR